ncbi:MAG: NAD(P)H-dependent oxidoreductase [Candidatus Kapabacteria bacterium]|nr:NAD(P)H-dependent oxidoreductase [Candidatus Kapabacteria bacterium]
MMTILGISGSLREASFNTGLLRTASVIAPEGVAVTIASIRDIPLYDAEIDVDPQPAAVTALKHLIARADGVLIATPEYNYSYSGVLKNTIDWMTRGTTRPFIDKPVAVVGASPGNFGAVRAQTDLRRLMSSVSGMVLPRPELLVSNVKAKVNEHGIITDEATLTVYRTLLNNFAAFIKHAHMKG